MRFLILLGTIIAVVLWLRWSLKRDQTNAANTGDMPTVEETPDTPLDMSEAPLETELRDAVSAFLEARGDTAEDAPDLQTALGSLAEKTSRLEMRVRADDGFARRVHQPVKRLLLALYSVVQRAARATHRSPGAERDTLVSASVHAITRAADQLGRVTEQADEAAMRKLEADLEVLEERLQDKA